MLRKSQSITSNIIMKRISYSVWSAEEKALLKSLVEVNTQNQRISWEAIVKSFPGRTKQQCKSLYMNTMKPPLKHNENNQMDQQQAIISETGNISKSDDNGQEQEKHKLQIEQQYQVLQQQNYDLPKLPELQQPAQFFQPILAVPINFENSHPPPAHRRISSDSIDSDETIRRIMQNQLNVSVWEKPERSMLYFICRAYEHDLPFIQQQFYPQFSIDEIKYLYEAVKQYYMHFTSVMKIFQSWNGTDQILSNNQIMSVNEAKEFYNDAALCIYKVENGREPPKLFKNIVSYLDPNRCDPAEMPVCREVYGAFDLSVVLENLKRYVIGQEIWEE